MTAMRGIYGHFESENGRVRELYEFSLKIHYVVTFFVTLSSVVMILKTNLLFHI
jgi:hypothetical protein